MNKKNIWKSITSIEDLVVIEKESQTNIVGIFKHSTRCGISKMVLKEFEQTISEQIVTNLYYLDLLNYRSISNEIALRFGVEHQSPQFIVLKDQKVIAHASHNQILELDVSELLK